MVFIKRLSAVFMLCLLTACSVSNNDKSITDIIGHFKESGLNVGKVSSKFSQMVMASDGAGIEIDGREVEIYKYDLNKADQKLTLEKIKKENKIELMGIVVSAKVNGSFVMINYSEHPQQAKLIDIFMNFTGKTAKAADSGGAISSKQPANNPAQIKDTPPPTPASGEKTVITCIPGLL